MAAEADGIKAKKLAEAEGERALAEARAANDEVNFKIESLKITTDAQVRIATVTAQIMANIGQNAEFVNIGGTGAKEATGNVLLDTISQIPALMKMLNAENQALNDRPVTDEVKDLSKAAFAGLGALKSGDESKESSATNAGETTGENAGSPAADEATGEKADTSADSAE